MDMGAEENHPGQGNGNKTDGPVSEPVQQNVPSQDDETHPSTGDAALSQEEKSSQDKK